MRNLKRALSLGLTAAMISGLMVMGSSAASYADVTSEDNVEAIEVLQAVGIMTGDDNGDFNPDEEVTRNEMAVIMCNLLNYTAASYADTCPFTDVPDWAEAYVAACYTNGIIAGYDATTFGGSDSVTIAQASLMLLKALGYFQYSADFGSDWQLATIIKGSTAGLYSGVSASATQALSRNDAAQMVLNALEAAMVEADGGSGVTVEGDGFTVTTGSATYNERTSSSNDYGALDDERDSNDGRYVMQLGEDLYEGDLRKSDDVDDFGRPSTIWSYQSSEIGTYADEADTTLTSTVTEREVYQAAGSTAYSNYDWTVYRNGETVFDGVEGADVLKYSRTSSERWQNTGNGVLTEMYVDSSDETVIVTLIDTFVGEVTRVTDNGDDYTVTISYQSGRPDGAETTYDTEQEFQDDDIVIVTVGAGEIQSMAVAETVEGSVTGVSSDSYVRVDGVTYNYNRAYCVSTLYNSDSGLVDLEDGGFGNPEVDNDVVIYLDSYGYAVAMEGAEEGVDDYLFVTGLDSAYGEISAKVVWADGTEDTIDIDEVDGVDAEEMSADADNYDDDGYVVEGMIYKWSISGSAYDLETVESVELTAADIRNGRASVINYYYADDDTDTESYTVSNSTVFVDAENNRMWTGYSNVTSKSSVEGALVMDGNVVEIVFISDSANSAAEDEDYVYIADDGYETTTVDGDTVYIFDEAYVNGAQVDLYVSSGVRSDIVENGEGLYLITEYDGTNEDWATDVDLIWAVEDSDAGSSSDHYATYARNGVLSLSSEDSNLTGGGQTSFSYDSDTTFVVVELQGDNDDTDDVYVGGISDIEVADDDDDRDQYTTAVYVLTVEDDSDDTPLAELVMIVVPSDDATSSGGSGSSGSDSGDFYSATTSMHSNGTANVRLTATRPDYITDDEDLIYTYDVYVGGEEYTTVTGTISAGSSSNVSTWSDDNFDSSDEVEVENFEFTNLTAQHYVLRVVDEDGNNLASELAYPSSTYWYVDCSGDSRTFGFTSGLYTAGTFSITDVDGASYTGSLPTDVNYANNALVNGLVADGDDYVTVTIDTSELTANNTYTVTVPNNSIVDLLASPSTGEGTYSTTIRAKLDSTPGLGIYGYEVAVSINGTEIGSEVLTSTSYVTIGTYTVTESVAADSFEITIEEISRPSVNADSISNSGTTYYIPFDRTLAEGTGINSITAGASGSTSAVSDAYVSGNTLVVVTGSELSDDQVIELPASAVVDASVSGNDNEAVTLTYSGGTWSAS